MDDGLLVAYILRNGGMSQQDLAETLAVGTRTVRARISRLNSMLEGIAHINHTPKDGYRLGVENLPSFERWMSSHCSFDAIPQAPDARRRYLFDDLLTRDSWVSLDELSAILFVSKSTLSADIKEIESRLNAYDLVLERRPHYGIRVAGDELSKRRCLANAVVEHILAESGTGGGTDYFLQSIPYVEIVDACLRQVFEADGLNISAVAYQNLLIHIAIALVRIREACYVPMEQGELEELKGTEAFCIATDVATAIETQTDINLPEEEIAYMAIHLEGKRTFDLDAAQSPDTQISDEIWHVVSEMIAEVKRLFHFDFEGDLELRVNLARHLVPLSTRLTHGMNMRNPLLKDIRVRYSLAFSMAVDACSVLSRRFRTLVSDDEVGYIALAFALALDRRKMAVTRKNVLVVCASGLGSAKLLEHQCKQQFGDHIGTITSCDVLNIDTVDFSDIDYVFTTVPIKQSLPVPVCQISLMLNQRETEDIRAILQSESALQHFSFFDRAMFLPHLKADTKDEVLEALLVKVAECRTIDERFAQLVRAREEAMTTAFGNLVAMPHALEPVGDETFICVGLLDHPIVWDDVSKRTVQAVFLFSFARGNDPKLQTFFGLMSEFLMSEKAVHAILETQTWEALMQQLALFGIAER